MKAALAALALLPFVAQAGVEHKGGASQSANVAHAAAARQAAHDNRFDRMLRFMTKHGRPKPGRCSA